MRRRVFCEDLGYESLLAAGILEELAERQIELVLSVRPKALAELPRALEAITRARVPVAVWPMLDDAEGRWASARTAEAFGRFVEMVLGAAEVSELLVDLEPPIADVRTLLDRPWRGLPRREGGPGAESLAGLVRSLIARSLAVSAAVVPLVLCDRTPGSDATGSRAASGFWQGRLGTPVDRVPFTTVNVMAYTSLFEGYSAGMLTRADARALLGATASAAYQRFGPRAAISVGAVHPGALGDERPYRSPDELAEDVGIARAAGIEDIALFDLRGVLARPPVSAWLDALVKTAPGAVPKLTSRAAVLVGLSLLPGEVARFAR